MALIIGAQIKIFKSCCKPDNSASNIYSLLNYYYNNVNAFTSNTPSNSPEFVPDIHQVIHISSDIDYVFVI